MANDRPFPDVQTLTFDLFGTVLDLGGSLTPHIAAFIEQKKSAASAPDIWRDWRARQRLEQYQDNILALGHSGYLETVRRALVYVLALHQVEATADEVQRLMGAWQLLNPFPDVADALPRLASEYRLVALSNGEPSFLEHLTAQRIRWDFDAVVSVVEVGAFKPHPGVYRHAAASLGLEPQQCMMVSANSFDVLGARSCGLRGAFVNRNRLPYEDSPYRPDLEVADFSGLAAALL